MTLTLADVVVGGLIPISIWIGRQFYSVGPFGCLRGLILNSLPLLR